MVAATLLLLNQNSFREREENRGIYHYALDILIVVEFVCLIIFYYKYLKAPLFIFILNKLKALKYH
jgi:hypothetical protein